MACALPTVGNASVHQLTDGAPGRAGVPEGMVELNRRRTVLSSHEQQIGDDIERFRAAEAEEPALLDAGGTRGSPGCARSVPRRRA
jgi:hypothetical protein